MSKGFTLIELIIVVAIIGVLAAVAVPKFVDVQENAKLSVFESNHNSLKSAVMLYLAENAGSPPEDMKNIMEYISSDKESLDGQPGGATYLWSKSDRKLTSTMTVSQKIYDKYAGTNAGKKDNVRPGDFKSDGSDYTYTITYTP